jgi:hypothetical protein
MALEAAEAVHLLGAAVALEVVAERPSLASAGAAECLLEATKRQGSLHEGSCCPWKTKAVVVPLYQTRERRDASLLPAEHPLHQRTSHRPSQLPTNRPLPVCHDCA